MVNDLSYNHLSYGLNICPRSVKDNTQDSGSCDVGSIPAEGVRM